MQVIIRMIWFYFTSVFHPHVARHLSMEFRSRDLLDVECVSKIFFFPFSWLASVMWPNKLYLKVNIFVDILISARLISRALIHKPITISTINIKWLENWINQKLYSFSIPNSRSTIALVWFTTLKSRWPY